MRILGIIVVAVVVQVPSTLGMQARAAPGLPPQDTVADAYAPAESESDCSPYAKPGAVQLRGLLLRAYPGSRDAGIVRSCAVGGPSAHWSGRAFDWSVDYYDPVERSWAEDFIESFLLATDEYAQTHSKARRLGIRYFIWNGALRSSYASPPYAGSASSAHTDHVHLSLSWPGAWASTDAYRNMFFGPDAVSWSAVDQAFFYRSASNTLEQRSFVGGAWIDGNRLGGSLTAGPAATSAALNRVDVFVRRSDFLTGQRTWQPAGWTGYADLGGPSGGLQSAPDASSWTSGTGNVHLNVFTRGPGAQLWVRTYNSQTCCPVGWSGWSPVPDPGLLTSRPGAASWAPGRIDVVVRSGDAGIWHKWCCAPSNPYGGGWSGWASLGGVIEGGPDLAARGPDDLWIVARNPSGELFCKRWAGAWSSWISLGFPPPGAATSDPTVVVRNGEVHTAVRGSDGSVWGRAWTPASGWGTWNDLGGAPW